MAPKDCECCHYGHQQQLLLNGSSTAANDIVDDAHHGHGHGHQHDEKYEKRRMQKHRRQERLRNVILLFLLSLVAFFFTFNKVLGGRKHHRHHPPRFDDQNEQQQQQHHRGHGSGGQGRRHGQGNKKGDDHGADDNNKSKSILDNINPFAKSKALLKLETVMDELNQKIHNNENQGIRWVHMGLVPPIPTMHGRRMSDNPLLAKRKGGGGGGKRDRSTASFFKVHRMTNGLMEWEVEANKIHKNTEPRHDFVDYTREGQDVHYEYPEKLMEPPARLGDYPKLMPLKELMEIWPQDELDHPPHTIQEELIHFDYTIPKEREAAAKFRDARLPFKVINVPEVVAAGQKWTDDYVSRFFDGGLAQGSCQESSDNYFAFFTPPLWDVELMGIPPTRNNDLIFSKWAQHARYADQVGLSPHQPHFYWQAGVDREERYLDKQDWSFISKDLPSFSSTQANFFQFEPEAQKGIQCRFGERGVTAATHFDGGRNMVAMISGAKRYILSPPRECSRLGIVPTRGNAIFRHSMLNFGHINHMDDPNMPEEERKWMEYSGTASALSTVLKAGEVLYIPSHWFHYITSLQKSAQCNVRSGIDQEGDEVFGGLDSVNQC